MIASLAAVYGFDAWRREHVGKRRIELAEEVLALFYQAKDAIADIRSPFGHGGEGRTRRAGPSETPEEKEALDRAFVLVERYGRHSELFAKIHAARYRFMAQVGVPETEPFDQLHGIVNELIVSAQRMARLTNPRFPHYTNAATEERNAKQLLEVEAIYYATGGDDDPIAPRVLRIVAEMEKTCRAIMESHGTLYSMINIRLRRLRRRAGDS